jgi:hypothetical protein
MCRQLLYIFLVGGLVLLIAIQLIWQLSVETLVPVLVLFIGILVVFLVRTWKNPHTNFNKWSVHIDDSAIYLNENPQGTQILRADITKVVESRSGLFVKGKEFGQQVWIPSGVEEYRYIRDELKGKVKGA